MEDSFEITYGNDDGYAGGSRPHHFDIDADEIEGMDEKSLKDFFWESIENDFTQRYLHLYSDQEEEFVAWAKEQISKMQEE